MSETAAVSLYVFLLWFCVAVSFTMSAVAAAAASFQPVELQRLGEGSPAEQRLDYLFKQRAHLDWSILMANTFANTGAVIASAKVLGLLNPSYIWLNVLFVTPIVLILGELIPRLTGSRFRRLLTGNAVWGLSALIIALSPLRLLFRGLFLALSKMLGLAGLTRTERLVEEQFLVILDQGTESGAVDQKEIDLIESVFELDDITVARIMTPRPDIFAIDADTPWREVYQICQKAEWSRIPVYEDRSDNIIGILLVKDLLKAPGPESTQEAVLRPLLLQPRFVPSSKNAEDTLKEFIGNKNHMSFVVDEHGTLVGLVTLDDLLAELVGDIDPQETDDDICELRANQFKVKGSADIEDLEEELGVTLPPGDYHNVAGFVFHELGRIPQPGDHILWKGLVFTVSTMDGRRIDEVIVEPDQSNQEAV
jgi:putative hemolysin